MFFKNLLLFCAFFNLTLAICPDETIASISDPSICYSFVNLKLGFMAADEFCVNIKGSLASIHNMFENMFISQEAMIKLTDGVSDDFWIGANNLYQPGIWSWIDGTSFDFTDWDIKQPQNITGSNCASVKIQGGQWHADDCYKAKPFVCEHKDTVTTTITPKPFTCPPSWTYYVVNGTIGYCYKVYENANWLDAETRCKVDHAHLASIHTLDENLFISNLAYYNGVDGCSWTEQAWIGLYTEDSEAHWKWTDDSPVNYTHWWPNGPHPASYNENCCYVFLAPCSTKYIENTGDIMTAPCSQVFSRFVCKKLPE